MSLFFWKHTGKSDSPLFWRIWKITLLIQQIILNTYTYYMPRGNMAVLGFPGWGSSPRMPSWGAWLDHQKDIKVDLFGVRDMKYTSIAQMQTELQTTTSGTGYRCPLLSSQGHTMLWKVHHLGKDIELCYYYFVWPMARHYACLDS